ncbi:MAG TPA: hypothetical protein VML75_04105 [Kofleriaceae bacterium]|nr:hypothetical protein [Kofleriaceae bacterium]
MKNLSFAALFVSLLAASCGGGKAAPTSPEPTEPGAAPTSEPGAPVAWKDLEFSARKKLREEKVLPEMKRMFAEFDSAKFADVTCQTCHGDGAIDGSFEMPNQALPVLPSTQEGWQKLGAEKPKWMEFMSTKVKPRMAELLGVPEFDPQQPENGGFGCHACHEMAK